MNFNFTAKLKKIEDVLITFLDSNYSDSWKNATFSSLSPSVGSVHFDQLVQHCKNLVSLGGKRWRPLFMVLCSELSSSPAAIELAYQLTPLVEMVHTASLIHDDIEDGADMRRGKPACHITYGLDCAINAGSWLYFDAFSAIDKNVTDEKLKNEFYTLLALQLRRLHLGQAMDIYWHRNPTILPSHDEYSAMVRLKTGTLASLSAQAGLLCSSSSKDEMEYIGNLASQIGEGFQVLDDIINITTGNVGKKRGDDIVEGKKSLPVIFHLEEKPSDKNRLFCDFETASKDGIDSPCVEDAISMLLSSQCIPRAKKYAEELISDSCKKIRQKYNDCETSLQIEQLFISMLKI